MGFPRFQVRLEAHSGLGSTLDDPRYVGLKNRGSTPPNVYALVLRNQLFHGVRAIRLMPLDESKMLGRDGMLAHSYMRGPTGQSSGCVSFRDYPAFLNAFLRGEVERLVVVDRLRTNRLERIVRSSPKANAATRSLPHSRRLITSSARAFRASSERHSGFVFAIAG